jgi:hypothetical protein
VSRAATRQVYQRIAGVACRRVDVGGPPLFVWTIASSEQIDLRKLLEETFQTQKPKNGAKQMNDIG